MYERSRKRRRTIGGSSRGRSASVSRRRKVPARRNNTVRRARRTVRRGYRTKRRIAAASRKKIKSVVKSVIACNENIGVYTKYYTGEIEPVCSAGRDKLCFAATRKQGNGAGYDVFSMAFTPFITKRVLNAASVLYSTSTKSVDILPQVTDFSHTGLKVEVLYASYHLALMNSTNIPYEIEILEITNKSTGDVNFLETAKELNAAMNWKGGVPFLDVAAGNQYDIDSQLEFSMIKGCSSRYNLKSYGMKTVVPGQTINYFVKDKMCIDFLKKQTTETSGGTADLGTYCRGEKQLIIRYRPILHVRSVSALSGFEYVANRATNLDNVSDKGFLVSVKEVYKIMEPDATTDANQGEHRVILNDEGDTTDSFTDQYTAFGHLNNYEIEV